MLLETLGVVVHILHEHKLRTQLQYDNVKGKWLNAKCDAMCAKLRLKVTSLFLQLCPALYIVKFRKICRLKHVCLSVCFIVFS